MPWVRRTRHLVLSATVDGVAGVVVRSLLTGDRVRLAPDAFMELLGVPAAEWEWRPDREAAVERLARVGLLVSDDGAEPFPTLRRRDEELTATGWWPEAAALHEGGRWDGVRARVPRRDGSRPAAPGRVGEPLPAFPERGGERVQLPRSGQGSPLRDVLAGRRTVRSFDAATAVTVAELATLLRWVWGAHGTTRLAGSDVGIRRTSPSGGSFHPIEVYPLVRRVDGLDAGVYHYLGGAHALERVAALDPGSVQALLEDATAGQWYFAEADVAFLMTARFRRSFRKYRHHPKAYRTIYLDAGHLSQTFYLLCTELGLGPWITAALNDGSLERLLGLDPLTEGVVALCGCGRPAPPRTGDGLHAAFAPLDPA